MESVREHSRQFSAVSISADKAAAALERTLRKYGPMKKVSFSDLNQAIRYLIPLKSFTTRFVFLGLKGWTLIVTDSRDSNCSVQAYAISRITKCNAIGVVFQEDRRELQVFEQGKEVQSLLDGDILVLSRGRTDAILGRS